MSADGSGAGYDVSALRARCLGPDRWRRLDVVAETGSTNADLIARAGTGEDIAGAVLIAGHQTRGRGRHGRSWAAPPGAQISMSVGVECADVPVDAWGWLPLATGVAVVDAVRGAAGVDTGLKWPNDVLAGERKLAGILAEVAPNRPVVVIGIGLNVGLTADELPAPHATSLRLLGAPVLDRTAVAAAALETLASRVEAWRRAGGADGVLQADYRSRSVTLGTRVRASVPGGGEVLGSAVDLDEAGRLVIDTGQGRVTVAAGDVTHLRPAGG
ncbi:biotin--[acetyl-CoA-carboxylase] ligase [Mycobacterium sp. PS03-16]|uniref:biotin--[acetyl-CoA-carboxylase] ligase n=1 Tax=Mycobacterium sp. PS03-16 TaxID=2559611 RepID=UPI0010730C12|nr:biotin--[acetyl-CoA-carboxylase] ligase [Mycobacterium sp. PS03-16]TFV58650.1 biotin--[acetyl-CoA-carboxylase] ligase [Mycobacterium sp. PS03-16]